MVLLLKALVVILLLSLLPVDEAHVELHLSVAQTLEQVSSEWVGTVHSESLGKCYY